MKVELHHGDLHELAWLRADGIDMALSAYGLASVTDLPRVLRQVHRVLRQEAPLVLSLPHPAIEMVAAGAADPLRIRRTWFDHSPPPLDRAGRQRHRPPPHHRRGVHRARRATTTGSTPSPSPRPPTTAAPPAPSPT